MGVRIVLAEGEPIVKALRRFKKLLERNGVTSDMRRHECFLKATQSRRKKKFRKRFKARRATVEAQTNGTQPVDSVVEAHLKLWKKTVKP